MTTGSVGALLALAGLLVTGSAAAQGGRSGPSPISARRKS
jgi:hypothetical protein